MCSFPLYFPARAQGQHCQMPLPGGTAPVPAAQRGGQGVPAEGAGVQQEGPGAGDPEPQAAGEGSPGWVQQPGPRLRGISVGKLMMKTLCEIKTGSLLQSCSSPTLQTTTDELSSRYVEMINSLREDKDREIRSLRVRGSAGTGCVQGQLLLQIQQQRSTTSTFWVSSASAVTLLIDTGDGSKPLQ